MGDRIPRLTELNVSQNLAAGVSRHSTKDAPIILVGYHEPSAVLLLGTHTILTKVDNVASLLLANQNTIAAVAQQNLPARENLLIAAGQKISRLEAIPGYNYSRGAQINMLVVQVVPSLTP